ncbi:MAG: FmdB family zinc ribbon protein [Chloroflexota bacterium]
MKIKTTINRKEGEPDMPIFEFVCSECGHEFEELLRSASEIENVRCESCDSPNVRKKLSLFASKSSSGTFSSSLSSSASSCNTGSV